MVVSQSKLARWTPNLGILWISVCSFWLCGSIVAILIIYRLVSSPSRYEIRQYVSLESIRTHECSRIIILFSLFPNCLLQMLAHFFYEPYRVLIRFAMYCYGLLIPKNKCSRRCGVIWKRKQHTFGTFDQVNKNCPFSRVRNAFSG